MADNFLFLLQNFNDNFLKTEKKRTEKIGKERQKVNLDAPGGTNKIVKISLLFGGFAFWCFLSYKTTVFSSFSI